MLITIKAMLIPRTTMPPATKLEIKFANEVVIYNFPVNFKNKEVKNKIINYNTYCINFWQKIKRIFI